MTGAIKTKNPNSSWILSWIIKGNNSPPTHRSGLLRHAYVLFNREDPMRLIAFKRLKVETLKSLGIWVSEIFTIVEIIKFTCRKIVHDEYFGYFRKGILFFQLNREDILSKKSLHFGTIFKTGEVFYLLKNKFIVDILECSKITKGILFFQLSRKDILFQRIQFSKYSEFCKRVNFLINYGKIDHLDKSKITI